MTTRWRGGCISASVRAVLAPNPGPMTLEGTNTWLLRTATDDDARAVVVDPGPAGEPGHLRAVHAAAGAVVLTLLTHHHRDHTGAVEEWRQLTPAPVRGSGHGDALADGERISADRLDLQIIATPGHTPDSVCILVENEGVLLTGDTVLGRGTSVVPWPEGDLGDYLASLDRIIALVRCGKVHRLAPGHGPVIDGPLAFLTELRDHRLQRLDQVRRALAGGARTASDVVERVYGDVAPDLIRPATATVRAQMAYLGHSTH